MGSDPSFTNGVLVKSSWICYIPSLSCSCSCVVCLYSITLSRITRQLQYTSALRSLSRHTYHMSLWFLVLPIVSEPLVPIDNMCQTIFSIGSGLTLDLPSNCTLLSYSAPFVAVSHRSLFISSDGFTDFGNSATKTRGFEIG